mgnify:CR=1 FL=1
MNSGAVVLLSPFGFSPTASGLDNQRALQESIIHAQYSIPKYLSKDAVEVLQKILNPDPDVRLTIPELYELLAGYYLQDPAAP